MGKPKYKFVIVATEGEPYVYQEMVPEPPPTPEKFQRRARFRRVRQQFDAGKIAAREYLDAGTLIRADYAERP